MIDPRPERSEQARHSEATRASHGGGPRPFSGARTADVRNGSALNASGGEPPTSTRVTTQEGRR